MRSELLLAAWLALWAVVVVVALACTVVRRQLLRRRYGGAALSVDLAGAVRKTAPYVLLFGASTCLVLLFAQVRLDRGEATATVVLAIDVSDSMLATDVQPDRFTAAKAAATSFLDEVPEGFRVGVVTFAGAARTAVEPGEDRAVVAEAIDGLTSSRGTVIGDGLAEALDVVAGRARVEAELPAAVVLLSDGADTGSVVPPDEAAARAREPWRCRCSPWRSWATTGQGRRRHGTAPVDRDRRPVERSLDRGERRGTQPGLRPARRPPLVGARGRQLRNAAARRRRRADRARRRHVPRRRSPQLARLDGVDLSRAPRGPSRGAIPR